MTIKSRVLIEEHGEIGHVRLNRADKRNALSRAMIADIGALFASPPKHWKAVVISGEGPHFSAGLDLGEHAERTPEAVMEISRLWHRQTEFIAGGDLPVIASLHGCVIGGGLELAAAAHIRVAEPNARYSLPEGRHGIFVGGGGSVRISGLIGVGRMTELMLTGREIDAEEGHRIGLSHMLVQDENGLEKAFELARTVASNAAHSNRMILHGLRHISSMPESAGLFAESVMVALTQTNPETRERLDAFLTRKDR